MYAAIMKDRETNEVLEKIENSDWATHRQAADALYQKETPETFVFEIWPA
jgi:hypothetical protein